MIGYIGETLSGTFTRLTETAASAITYLAPSTTVKRASYTLGIGAFKVASAVGSMLYTTDEGLYAIGIDEENAHKAIKIAFATSTALVTLYVYSRSLYKQSKKVIAANGSKAELGIEAYLRAANEEDDDFELNISEMSDSASYSFKKRTLVTAITSCGRVSSVLSGLWSYLGALTLGEHIGGAEAGWLVFATLVGLSNIISFNAFAVEKLKRNALLFANKVEAGELWTEIKNNPAIIKTLFTCFAGLIAQTGQNWFGFGHSVVRVPYIGSHLSDEVVLISNSILAPISTVTFLFSRVAELFHFMNGAEGIHRENLVNISEKLLFYGVFLPIACVEMTGQGLGYFLASEDTLTDDFGVSHAWYMLAAAIVMGTSGGMMRYVFTMWKNFLGHMTENPQLLSNAVAKGKNHVSSHLPFFNQRQNSQHTPINEGSAAMYSTFSEISRLSV